MTATRRHRSWSVRALAALLVLVLLAVGGIVVWSRLGLMGAEAGPLRAVEQDPGITIEEDSATMVLRPADAEPSRLGLVFYSGAKVDAAAYAARLSGLVTERGMTVVIVKPWLHLALFDRRGLETFTEHASDVSTWLVGGHSLGGVRACQVAPDADGLLLFGSYCANDISDSGLPVLSLSGSKDDLSTPEKIAEARNLLPADADMVEIEGASHASFGDYGPQDGDGTPRIDDEEMNGEVTSEISEFVSDAGALEG